jgi:hypothetical protein
LPRRDSGYLDITDCIIAVVNNEFPLHYELLCQKVAPFLGKDKVSIKVKKIIDNALKRMSNDIYRKGNFLFPSNNSKIIVRIPNPRNISHISVEEIAEAMTKILVHLVGASKKTLYAETIKAYGFYHLGSNIASAMNAACNLLVRQGKVKIVDGKIVLLNN